LLKNLFAAISVAAALSISASAAPQPVPSGERISHSANPPAGVEALVEVAPVAKASTRRPSVKRDRELEFTLTPEVQKFLRYYTAGRGRGIAIRGINRSSDLAERAEEIFREEGVPTDLIWLAQVESGWRPTAVSPVGASGIWQFMPATAERFKMSATGDDFDERMDFEKATRGAAKYLRWLANRYDGNWLLAIGAYNCGEGNMDKAISRAGSRDFWTIARAGALPTETANYVPAVLAASLFGTEPGYYSLEHRDAIYATLGD
jgi:membrane-bound lytic murein transglycosylase D